MNEQMKQFHWYTKTWMELQEARRHDTNYVRLAVHLRSTPDGENLSLEESISLAQLCQRYYFDLNDGRYQRRKAALEASGWSFVFDGWRWLAEASGLEVRGDTLSELLANVEGWGQSMLWQWSESDTEEAPLLFESGAPCAIAAG